MLHLLSTFLFGMSEHGPGWLVGLTMLNHGGEMSTSLKKRVADYVGVTAGKELCHFRLTKENIATVLWKDLDHGYIEKGPTMMMIGCQKRKY